MRRHIQLGAYALSCLCGMALGAGLTVKYLDKEYEKNVEKEVLKAKKYYDRLHKRGEFADPIRMVEEKAEEAEEADEIIKVEGYVPKPIRSVFDISEEDQDVGEEIRRDRSPDRPYVISETEYMSDDSDFEHVFLNYYAHDGVLATINDDYLRESDDIVGDDNLLRFGEGCADKDTVFVRNERTGKIYEVVRTQGSYAELVHGVIEHADTRRKVPKKFRRDDE